MSFFGFGSGSSSSSSSSSGSGSSSSSPSTPTLPSTQDGLKNHFIDTIRREMAVNTAQTLIEVVQLRSIIDIRE